MKGAVPAEYAHVDERPAEVGFTAPPCFLSPCLLLSSYLFEADDCLLLQGLYRVSSELHSAHTCSGEVKKYVDCGTVCGPSVQVCAQFGFCFTGGPPEDKTQSNIMSNFLLIYFTSGIKKEVFGSEVFLSAGPV